MAEELVTEERGSLVGEAEGKEFSRASYAAVCERLRPVFLSLDDEDPGEGASRGSGGAAITIVKIQEKRKPSLPVRWCIIYGPPLTAENATDIIKS